MLIGYSRISTDNADQQASLNLLNRTIEKQRHLFLLCRSRGTTIDLLEDGMWASVAHNAVYQQAMTEGYDDE